MKRLFLITVLLMLLCGCGMGSEYVAVEPHNEDFEVAVDSDAMKVSNFLSLKNAMLNLVKDGVAEGVIRAESYSGDITKDLDDAVYELSRSDPLGTFAVDYMTYDYSKIVSYYEIHIHTTFRRTVEEINSVAYVDSEEQLKQRLRDAMMNYDDAVIVRYSSYFDTSLKNLAEEIRRENPEAVFEIPEMTVNDYPENGTQRIQEIQLDYETDRAVLQAYGTELQEKVCDIAALYGSDLDEHTSIRRLYDRVIRDGTLLADDGQGDFLEDSPYGALIQGTATSYGYAQAYCLLLREKEIPCTLVSGTLQDQLHYWCRLELSEGLFYVDPAMGIRNPDVPMLLMPEESLEEWEYTLAE
ncbi:MAG: hypothetical protein PUC06_04655 [Oscillospiraceae bacterium]|nr:hypothetical protein [Oscillospiraceae bacterium]